MRGWEGFSRVVSQVYELPIAVPSSSYVEGESIQKTHQEEPREVFVLKRKGVNDIEALVLNELVVTG
jgi:hypothetical protein